MHTNIEASSQLFHSIKGTIAYIIYRVFLLSFIHSANSFGNVSFKLKICSFIYFLSHFFPQHAHQLAVFEFCTEKGSRSKLSKEKMPIPDHVLSAVCLIQEICSLTEQIVFSSMKKVTVPSSVFLLPHTSHCL